MQPSATPVISCLKSLFVTSPAAKIPGVDVSDVLWSIIISFALFTFTPSEIAKSLRTMWPIATKMPSKGSLFEFL